MIVASQLYKHIAPTIVTINHKELTASHIDSIGGPNTDVASTSFKFSSSIPTVNKWQIELGMRSRRALGLGPDRSLDQELVVVVVSKPRGGHRGQFHPIR